MKTSHVHTYTWQLDNISGRLSAVLSELKTTFTTAAEMQRLSFMTTLRIQTTRNFQVLSKVDRADAISEVRMIHVYMNPVVEFVFVGFILV